MQVLHIIFDVVQCFTDSRYLEPSDHYNETKTNLVSFFIVTRGKSMEQI